MTVSTSNKTYAIVTVINWSGERATEMLTSAAAMVVNSALVS